jgi:hypothetical protein
MRIRNLVVESTSLLKLNSLLEDYKIMGFDAEIRAGKLTIYCINRKLKTRKQKNRELKKNANRYSSSEERSQVSKRTPNR